MKLDIDVEWISVNLLRECKLIINICYVSGIFNIRNDFFCRGECEEVINHRIENIVVLFR